MPISHLKSRGREDRPKEKMLWNLRRIVDVVLAMLFGIWLGLYLGPKFLHPVVPNSFSGLSLQSSSSSLSYLSSSQPSKVTVDFSREISRVVSNCSAARPAQGGMNIPLDRRPRLLFMSAVYSFDQFLYLQKVLDAMRDHCNAGWNVTVHLQVANGMTHIHPRYVEIQDRAYCYDMKSYMPIILDSYGKIGFGLNSKHRKYVLDHLDEYDYFSYAEEDMLLTVSHLRAILEGEKLLKSVLPKTWLRYTIGFFRWEDSIVDSERVSWEYFPERMHVVDMGPRLGKFVVTNNLNQAIYVLSRDHIYDLEKRCGFLTDTGQNKFYSALRRAMDSDWKYLSVGVSEWSSSFQQILQCGMRRIVPLEHLQTYMIQHTTNKAQKRRLRRELLNITDWVCSILLTNIRILL